MMLKEDAIRLFQDRKVRVKWDEDKEQWFFSIVDVIAVLTESSKPRRYWSDLKIKLKDEGFELYEKIVQLKIMSSDGKQYETDCTDTETLLRLIQSIPSKIEDPDTFDGSKDIAKRGGSVAGNARKDIEKQTKRPVITKKNANDFLKDQRKKSISKK